VVKVKLPGLQFGPLYPLVDTRSATIPDQWYLTTAPLDVDFAEVIFTNYVRATATAYLRFVGK
jgi:hypothetical protein